MERDELLVEPRPSEDDSQREQSGTDLNESQELPQDNGDSSASPSLDTAPPSDTTLDGDVPTADAPQPGQPDEAGAVDVDRPGGASDDPPSPGDAESVAETGTFALQMDREAASLEPAETDRFDGQNEPQADAGTDGPNADLAPLDVRALFDEPGAGSDTPRPPVQATDANTQPTLASESPTPSSEPSHDDGAFDSEADRDAALARPSAATGSGLALALGSGVAARWSRFTSPRAASRVREEGVSGRLDRLGVDGLHLMSQERIDSALNLSDDQDSETEADTIVVLTDRRLIQFTGGSGRRTATFVQLRNVDAVEVTTERQGYGGYVWGALAILAATMLWWVWENPVGSFAAAAIVTLMGVYLIVDQILSPGRTRVNFRVGPSELQCGVDSGTPSEDIYGFVNRLFQLKAEDAKDEGRDALSD